MPVHVNCELTDGENLLRSNVVHIFSELITIHVELFNAEHNCHD